jgi:predicted MFS family arabinose efflux permease
MIGLLFLPFFRRVSESPLVSSERIHVPIRHLVGIQHGRLFWMAGVAALLASTFPAVGLAFTTERLVSELGFSAGQATALALTAGTIGGSGFWIGGRLADEWGRKPTTMVALFCSILGGVVLFRFDSTVLVFIGIALGAFGSFAYVPAASTHRAELFPTELRATATAGNAYLATLGSAAGLGFGALTIDSIGLDLTMGLLSIPMGIAIVLTWWLPETKDQSLVSEKTAA